MVTGNKGEWSELYVLLKLLADGKLYAADENSRKLEDVYFPILRIFGQEYDGQKITYTIPDNKDIELYINGDRIHRIPMTKLKEYADKFYHAIVNGQGKGAFEIEGAEEIMSELRCKTIKAPSNDKSDITLEMNTGRSVICGYSIKSDLGNPPTLFNASKSTKFVFEVQGLTDADIDTINAIETKSKVKDRVQKIQELGSIRFDHMSNETFEGNLVLIDSFMDDIVADMLLSYFGNEASDCADIATCVEKKNRLGYKRQGAYRYKIKKFLCAIALGLMPASQWSGQDEASGGYIIVDDSGDVMAYQIYNRDSFETYLLNNTKLDTPDGKRHDFGRLYKENGKTYIELNLQIRFTGKKKAKPFSFPAFPASAAADTSASYE